MLKKSITYTDYNGASHTDDFYFHLNKFEITEIEASIPGGKGLKESAVNWHNSGDTMALFNLMKTFILKSYGVKDEDGMHFIKTDSNGNDLGIAFEQSAAFEALMSDLLDVNDLDGVKLSEFLSGIIPKDMLAN